MKNSPVSQDLSLNQMDQLVPTNKVKVPLGEPICKINISGYSLDNYKTINPDGYTILCRLGETCDGFSYFPNTSKIVLNTRQQSQLIHNFDRFKVISNIAKDFGITEQVAGEKYVDFFSNTQLTVEPTGIQGRFYRLMQGAQNSIPAVYTSQAVVLLKTTGMTGIQIISKAPLTFVGGTYVGAIFFGYCGSIAGDNPLGLVLNSTSFVLSRPMRVVEITLNGLILRPISNAIGLPLILNGTQEILTGKGISIQDYTTIEGAFEKIMNSKVVRKCIKIYRILRDKNE